MRKSTKNSSTPLLVGCMYSVSYRRPQRHFCGFQTLLVWSPSCLSMAASPERDTFNLRNQNIHICTPLTMAARRALSPAEDALPLTEVQPGLGFLFFSALVHSLNLSVFFFLLILNLSPHSLLLPCLEMQSNGLSFYSLSCSSCLCLSTADSPSHLTHCTSCLIFSQPYCLSPVASLSLSLITFISAMICFVSPTSCASLSLSQSV